MSAEVSEEADTLLVYIPLGCFSSADERPWHEHGGGCRCASALI